MDYCSAIRGILNSNQGGPLYPVGLRMVDALKHVRESLQVNIALGRDTLCHALIDRLAKCIDNGLEATAERFKEIRQRVEQVRAVGKTLDPGSANSEEREEAFKTLREGFAQKEDPIEKHMAKVMESFRVGLFAGGDDLDIPEDNLDLERWFGKPKSHERRIHGHRHAGTRIVQEGPTKTLVLDAHLSHPQPYRPEELIPYRKAEMPETQKAAIHRRKIRRKARSKNKLKLLLKDLEQWYLNGS